MDLLRQTYAYFEANQARFWQSLGQHITLSWWALAISMLLAIPLGILLTRLPRIAPTLITVLGGLRLIPSIAVLFLALPYLGTGFRPALLALTLLALPPILINTYSGIRNVERSTIEAARGMGMEAQQILTRIELPLALPAILTGVRTAATEVIASASLAAFIGGGGLGDFITRGFALYDPPIMLLGALSVAVLAICAELLFAALQYAASTKLGLLH